MNISSRNVNGLRAIITKDFFPRVKATNPDIICLQEVKAFANQIPPEIRLFLPDYDFLRHHWTRAGYAGTAILYKKNLGITEKWSEAEARNIAGKADFNDTCFSDDGRVTQLDFHYNGKEISLLNIYFPNWGIRADGTEMLTYKLNFYECYRNYINQLQNEGKLVISTGDFNICHKAIDIARPEENKNSIGFLPIERAEMDKLVADHYIDVFRHFNPNAKDKYTRWSYRAEARARNVGRRLDYFRISEQLLPLVAKIEHQENVQGSDHCPILLTLK